jgi:hypothetical protein
LSDECARENVTTVEVGGIDRDGLHGRAGLPQAETSAKIKRADTLSARFEKSIFLLAGGMSV